jgi:predicted kinase
LANVRIARTHETVMPTLLVLRGPPGSGKTTVARLIAQARAGVKVVEVDDVKAKRYGTAVQCIPAEDFPEAGRWARSHIDAGFNVVAVEFFNDREHVDLMLTGFGWPVDDVELVFAWLDCNESTAVARKSPKLTESVVLGQHARKAGRFRPDREALIDTTDRAPDDVVKAVLPLLPESPAN